MNRINRDPGPIFAGAVADVTGSLFAGLATSVVDLIAVALAAALQR